MNALSRIISFTFHPLLMPTLLFGVLSQIFPQALEPIQPPSHALFILLIFIVTFLLPVLNLGILKTFGTIRSFHLYEKKERYLPFTIIAFVYCFITYLFYTKTRISLDDTFMKLMIIVDLLAIIATIATFAMKVSVHSLVMWGIIGIMIPLNKLTELNSLFYPTLIIIVLTGFIMSARLQLAVHTLKEVMWGSILGLATSITAMFFLFQY